MPDPDAPAIRCLTLSDEAALGRLAAAIATRARPGDMIALEGDLGSGKTSFARAFIWALQDVPEEVPSPTFTLVQHYDTKAGPVLHVDLYRIEDPAEIAPLGLAEALATSILLVEWPDRLADPGPTDRLTVRLEFGSTPDSRQVALEGRGRWAGLVDRLAEESEAHG